jgi:hypothetical protein
VFGGRNEGEKRCVFVVVKEMSKNKQQQKLKLLKIALFGISSRIIVGIKRVLTI